MNQDPRIFVIIPAFNEEKAVGKVIAEIPEFVEEVVVVNNGSTDDTPNVVKAAGATSIDEPEKGYGAACLKGIEYVSGIEPKPDIIVFIDADHSDYPEEMNKVVEPIISGNADLVIGSRALGDRESGSMTVPQVFGNWLATGLLKLFYGARFTDLGPFRAITFTALEGLGMKDRNYGWTVEMQLKAAKQKLRNVEVAVNYRQRIGQSKVSGTIKGTIMAGYKILWTIFRYL